ncbi:hypothetical protein C8R42DRAFT_640989 [Lentinula raphanica]|nr:hypothetical protein C8R42DRAFT_640989 [Lentinula raphanica]
MALAIVWGSRLGLAQSMSTMSTKINFPRQTGYRTIPSFHSGLIIAKALGIEPYDAVSATGAKLNVYTKGSEYSIPFATAEAQVPEKQKSGHLLFRWGQKNSDGESGPVVEVVWDGSEGSTEVDVRHCAEMWKALGLPEGHS